MRNQQGPILGRGKERGMKVETERQGGKEKTEEGLKSESMVGKNQMELRSFKVAGK